MGSIVGKAMDENMKKQQAFMVENQKTMLERQIQMQNLMREKMMAFQLAKSRECFTWLASGYSVIAFGLLAGFRRTRNPGVVAPLVPLGFVLAYNYDLAYGSKIHRIREEADRMLAEEGSLLELPQGLPTLVQIEERRGQADK
ncbi:plasminogen receptor (KT)-like [Lineus longissimus]|uniref:plasminogen receptor (KT)-like n=1 Tax=Lineus longissimus TaxID=88925 RepID=UPI002B4F8196